LTGSPRDRRDTARGGRGAFFAKIASLRKVPHQTSRPTN